MLPPFCLIAYDGARRAHERTQPVCPFVANGIDNGASLRKLVRARAPAQRGKQRTISATTDACGGTTAPIHSAAARIARAQMPLAVCCCMRAADRAATACTREPRREQRDLVCCSRLSARSALQAGRRRCSRPPAAAYADAALRMSSEQHWPLPLPRRRHDAASSQWSCHCTL